MLINGCQEGKVTPKLVEIQCPSCKAVLEVFVRMGGAIGETGTMASDETCEECGAMIPAGSHLTDYVVL